MMLILYFPMMVAELLLAVMRLWQAQQVNLSENYV